MRKEIKQNKCMTFFYNLAKYLEEEYEVIGSCNQDCSRYLVPKGTASQITYYSKPAYSFRISDHWNWYSNVKKCSDPTYIQCNSVDLPRPNKRADKGKPSTPIFAYQVAFADENGTYHHIFGDKYNGVEFSWKETSVEEVGKMLKEMRCK